MVCFTSVTSVTRHVLTHISRTNLPAPDIAKDYWRLGPDAKFLDVMYAVRSDESTHRFVNHSLANLKYESDVNPFAIHEPNMTTKGSRIWYASAFSFMYSPLAD